jgi:arylsulfatase A-like enzyme
MFGKWHIGEKAAYHPSARGFDEAIVSMGQHFDFRTNPETEHARGEYLADFISDRAVDFIARHRRKPFFLYVPHFAVHKPLEAKPKLVERFRDKPAVGGHGNATYAAMIAAVDQSVGRIIRALEEHGLTEDTVLIFTSDNGGVGGYAREGLGKSDADGQDVTDNAPLRSGKGSLYEGGLRVPLIVRWPGVTPPGTTCGMPTLHVDFFPTMLEITAARPPRQRLDGKSLVGLLRDPSATLQRDAIFHHFPGYLGLGRNVWRTTPVSVVQAGDWKLLEFLEDGRLELYDLATDVGETRNRAADEPERAAELRRRLSTWRTSVGAAMPAPRPANAPGRRSGDQPQQERPAAAGSTPGR